MKIVIHLGAHCTDEDSVLGTLGANRAALAPSGIVIPEPAAYRPLLREALAKLRGADAPPDMAAALLRQVRGPQEAQTVVLGSEGFVCAPRFVLGQRRIYPMIGDRLKALAGLFPGQPLHFTLGLRNPATFIPALHARMQAEIAFERLTAPVALDALRWSETLHSMRKAAPQADITAWCDEDRPLIWTDILQAVSGHAADLHLDGTEDVLAPLLRPGGMERLRAYLAERPDMPAAARRRVNGIFLEKFADPDVLEDRFDLPGWSDVAIWEMTRAYELDLERIAQIPDVTFLRA